MAPSKSKKKEWGPLARAFFNLLLLALCGAVASLGEISAKVKGHPVNLTDHAQVLLKNLGITLGRDTTMISVIILETIVAFVLAKVGIWLYNSTVGQKLVGFVSATSGTTRAYVMSYGFFRTLFPGILIFTAKNPWNYDILHLFDKLDGAPLLRMLIAIVYVSAIGFYIHLAIRGNGRFGNIAIPALFVTFVGCFQVYTIWETTTEEPSGLLQAFFWVCERFRWHWSTVACVFLWVYIVCGLLLPRLTRKIGHQYRTDDVDHDSLLDGDDEDDHDDDHDDHDDDN